MSGQYAGSELIRRCLKVELSPLGENVADLLGELVRGIYHFKTKHLMRVDWSNDYCIQFTTRLDFSSFDYGYMTRLVFLAHHMAIRVNVEAATHGYLKFTFHKRGRDASKGTQSYHPSIDEAVDSFKRTIAGSIDEISPRNDTEKLSKVKDAWKRFVDWSGDPYYVSGYNYDHSCFFCESEKRDGHEKNCPYDEINKILEIEE